MKIILIDGVRKLEIDDSILVEKELRDVATMYGQRLDSESVTKIVKHFFYQE